MVRRLPKDTVRFVAAASAAPCAAPSGRGVLLQGASGGNGVLLWLRSRDSLAPGELPVLQRVDSTTPTGAIVGARYMIGEVAHGVPLDSGAVTVTRVGPRVTARVRASGLDVAGGSRVALDATFDAVPVGPDAVPCRQTP
ncbi:MAG TPA: hypothetical protein VEU55_00675 [Gemmatimonadales bacterium]|nr:hypothetical protein [Gemmatimonadales bacterium]